MSKEFDDFKKFTLMNETPSAPASDKTEMLSQPQMIIGEHSIQMLEISDEEIYKASREHITDGGGAQGWIEAAFRQGAVWYREQLRQKTK
jgi:hypothetical protein